MQSSLPPLLPPAPDLAAFSRPHAQLCLQVARFLTHSCHVDIHGSVLLLAVSGGADSTALLSIFTALRPYTGHSLSIVHIDHGLRPESPLEAQSVAALCAAWHLPCTLHSAPVTKYAAEHKIGLEEAGRALRYQILETERQNTRAAWIVTGHHREDLAEDMLLRLIRGTGWPALGGMAAVDRRRKLLRPLLLCAPESLRVLVQDYGLTWQQDPSNADITYSRNRVRHTIMPLLKAENPSLHQGMENLWTLAQEDTRHWENILNAALAHYHITLTPPVITLPKALLCSMDRATRLRMYIQAVHSLAQGQARATTLFQVDDAWQEGRGNTHFQLHGNISVEVLRGNVIFRAKA
ncbi:MAG: tRNA lysidine(34) synthetase TilS [Desulfovibrionaceae bacterium]